MFNLFRSSDKLKKYLLGGLLTLVALSMITYLIPNYNTGTTDTTNPVLANIGGKKITALEAQQLFQKYSAGRIPADLMEVYLPQFVESMISQRAALYQAAQLGLTSSDDEAFANLVANYPQFFPNGTLSSKDAFEQALAQQGITLQDVVDEAHDQVILRKLQGAVLGSIVVTPKEIEEEFRKKYERAKIQYVAFPAAKFRDGVKLSDDEVRKFYESTKASYALPEKLAYQVAVLDQEKVAATIVTLSAFIIDWIFYHLPYFSSIKEYFLTHNMTTWVHIFLQRVPWMTMAEDYAYLLAMDATFVIIGVVAFQVRDFKS